MERYAFNRIILATGIFALAITSAVLVMVNNKSVKKVAKTVRETAADSLKDTLEKMAKGELPMEA